MPIPLLKINTIKSVDKVLYSVMMNDYPFYLKERGVYQPAISILARDTGSSESTIKRSLSSLEDLGYISAISKKTGCVTIWQVYEVDKDGLPKTVEDVITDRIESITGIKSSTSQYMATLNNDTSSGAATLPQYWEPEDIEESPF
ncbi:hypothetical protein GNP84_16080 [Aliivibrio fischeri]|uniref:hypothetical protein n=1 Tax=Aliivibrio fischeri TaxID=668 RepID=UPI0012D91D28|nr:hypothetical protein [Aliivibrio fischeri]MUK78406.1 hypothetical protein [Aliivibrio fischeri]